MTDIESPLDFECCGSCRFFDGDHCRRHAPASQFQNRFPLIAMLQAIAWALIAANRLDVKKAIADGLVDGDVLKEVTEQYLLDAWPAVHDETDWCGEWQCGRCPVHMSDLKKHAPAD
jgi:hypothetical protein